MLGLLGTKRSLVVHGDGGLGEITIAGETAVTEVAGDTVREHRWTAADFGLTAVEELNDLEIGDAAQSAALIRRILAGEPGAARDIVVANSAAALWVVDPASSLPAAAKRAQQAIDSGAAKELLSKLVDYTNRF